MDSDKKEQDPIESLTTIYSFSYSESDSEIDSDCEIVNEFIELDSRNCGNSDDGDCKYGRKQTGLETIEIGSSDSDSEIKENLGSPSTNSCNKSNGIDGSHNLPCLSDGKKIVDTGTNQMASTRKRKNTNDTSSDSSEDMKLLKLGCEETDNNHTVSEISSDAMPELTSVDETLQI